VTRHLTDTHPYDARHPFCKITYAVAAQCSAEMCNLGFEFVPCGIYYVCKVAISVIFFSRNKYTLLVRSVCVNL